MPHHSVRRFQNGAVQFEHEDTGEAGERSGSGAGGGWVDGESSPQHKPGEQGGGYGVQYSRCQASDALVHEAGG